MYLRYCLSANISSYKENDKKIKLLYAVEPFLNEKRRDKVNHCVKFLTFAELAKDLKDI